MKIISSIIMILIVCAYSNSQTGVVVIKPIAPKYPPTAIAVGASGEVNVLVSIDAAGKVFHADAYSGHPLLRNLAKTAALEWQFEKAENNGISRQVLLTFIFDRSGTKIVEESDKKEEDVIVSSFPTPYSTQIDREIHIPKLLLLPREKGNIKSKACELHQETMEVEIQSVSNEGDETYSIEFTENFFEASFELFPNANTVLWRAGHDLLKETEKAEFFYCKLCRSRREQWIREHKID